MLLIAVAPKLVPSRHASRWTRNHGHDSPVWAARNHWKATKPDRRQERGDERLPVAAAPDGDEGGDGAGGDEGDAVRSRRRRQRGRDPREQPPLVEQEPQARRGEHDQQRLGVGVGEHERTGEHGEQDHRPLGDVVAVQAAGEHTDEDDGDEGESRRDSKGGERVATGQDAVGGAHDHRVQREERGACLDVEVGDVRGQRPRVAVADDLQVPQAVPLREHAGDQAEGRARPRFEVLGGVHRDLAGTHTGAGEDAQT